MRVFAAPLVQRTFTMRRNMIVLITSYAVFVLAVIVVPLTSDRIEQVTLGLIGAVCLIVVVAVLLHSWSVGHLARTDELLVAEDAFIAPFSTGANALVPVAFLPFLAALIPLFVRVDPEQGWDPSRLAIVAILIGLFLTVIVGYGIGVFRGNHTLVISPVGVQVPRAFGSMLVPWTALDAETALPPSKRDAVELVVTDLRQVIRLGPVTPRRVLRVQSSLVNQVFLGEVLRYYVEHPQHQPAIGTQAELDRLHADLADETARPERAPFIAWSTRG
ncbi:hypothetical protein F4553_002878 [Allocatelliglobosispora scoriae]|uniref:PH domain-containing protein n=1 Tax=Allocatelliglobosispora scoriae TaxID=643052 RepID=A0A841BQN6_9ACTN|nr:hypothetical protein [Allocatelliglobosispora scoriae]MBB5869499.1 hypothetical protein [Allocatelliglobosispora scoriae]